MKKNFYRNLTLFLALLTLASFAGYYLLFSVIKEKNVTIADASLDLEVRAKQAAASESIRKVINESQNEIGTIENYFINPDGAVDFIEYLEAIAKDLPVVLLIQDVQEKDSEAFGSKAELHFKVAVQGTWIGVYRFLAVLEKIPYGVMLGYVDLKKNTGGQSLTGSGSLPSPGSTVPVKVGAWQGDFEFTVLKHK